MGLASYVRGLGLGVLVVGRCRIQRRIRDVRPSEIGGEARLLQHLAKRLSVLTDLLSFGGITEVHGLGEQYVCCHKATVTLLTDALTRHVQPHCFGLLAGVTAYILTNPEVDAVDKIGGLPRRAENQFVVYDHKVDPHEYKRQAVRVRREVFSGHSESTVQNPDA